MRNRPRQWLGAAVMLTALAGCASQPTLPKQETRLTHLADELARRGDTTSAVTLYGRAAAATPDNPDILIALGNAHLKNGDPTAATEAFQQAYRLRDGDAQAVLGLGYAALIEGRLRRANDLIARAAPELHTFAAYNLLGVVSTLTGSFDQAMPAFQAAQARDPSNLEIKTNEALARALSSDMDHAVQQIEAVITSPLAEPHHTRRAVLILTLANKDQRAEALVQDLPPQERGKLLTHARQIRQLPDVAKRAAAMGIMPAFASIRDNHR